MLSQNTRETCHAIRGMTLTRARAFLNNVVIKREAVAFCRFNGGVGRNPQIKTGSTQGRWPEKSARHLLDLLQNAESNAELQGLDTAQLYVHHIQCQPGAQAAEAKDVSRTRPYQPVHEQPVTHRAGAQHQGREGEEGERGRYGEQEQEGKEQSAAAGRYWLRAVSRQAVYRTGAVYGNLGAAVALCGREACVSRQRV